MIPAHRLHGDAITGYDVLDAREARALRQSQWLDRHDDCCLVSMTLNIAGPVKRTPLIEDGFRAGLALVDDTLSNLALPVLRGEEWLPNTGCEAFRLVQGDPAEVKRAMVGVEQSCPFGRLLDIDVLSPDGIPLSRTHLGLPGRRCLVCGDAAQVCGRSQRHSYDQLRDVTNQLIQTHLMERRADRVSALACRAMLCEVLVTPKPGLVDRANSGSHADMDVFTFAASASAITPYLRQAYLLGRKTPDRVQLLTALRGAGRLAEEEMYRATGRVNTHKGMIYSTGLLCGALGRCEEGESSSLLAECGALARLTMEADFGSHAPTRTTTGQSLYKAHGIGGIRAEAAEGFPSVRQVALPLLTRLINQGLSPNDAGAYTLLALLGRVTDTNMIARGGMDAASEAKDAARALLPDENGALPPLSALSELDEQFIRDHLSPGGCADLLAIAFFLYYLNEENPTWQM